MPAQAGSRMHFEGGFASAHEDDCSGPDMVSRLGANDNLWITLWNLRYKHHIGYPFLRFMANLFNFSQL